MLVLSWDGDALLGDGGLWVCTECEESSTGYQAIRHAPGCPVDPDGAAPAPAAAARCSDPRLYVWTARGIEREVDVDRRRERREPQRPFGWWE